MFPVTILQRPGRWFEGAAGEAPVDRSGHSAAFQSAEMSLGTAGKSACATRTVTVRKGAISVGQDGILRGDWQSPRVPVANRDNVTRSRY